MRLDEARARFAEARVARLATVRPTGAPHVVPIVFVVQDERLTFAIDAKPKRSRGLVRLANIEAEPRVSILVDHYSERWDELWWIRVDGRARTTDDPAGLREAVDSLARKYPAYRSHPPPGPAVLVELDSWSYWPAD